MTKVQPTPYQRDLSKAHAERLLTGHQENRPVRRPEGGRDVRSGDVYWTPNGNHRRHALEKLKTEFIPAIVVVEPEVAYQILALNTEKARHLQGEVAGGDADVPRPA